MSFPVTFDVDRPPLFRRVHVFLRLAMLVIVGWISHPLGLLWLGIPVVAAIRISQKGGRRYVDEDGPTVTRVLGWILGVVAYLALLADRLPGGNGDPVRLEIERSGSPTVGSALLRIIYAIPSLIVLAIFSVIGAIVWVSARKALLGLAVGDLDQARPGAAPRSVGDAFPEGRDDRVADELVAKQGVEILDQIQLRYLEPPVEGPLVSSGVEHASAVACSEGADEDCGAAPRDVRSGSEPGERPSAGPVAELVDHQLGTVVEAAGEPVPVERPGVVLVAAPLVVEPALPGESKALAADAECSVRVHACARVVVGASGERLLDHSGAVTVECVRFVRTLV
jgi:hypothetical protein